MSRGQNAHVEGNVRVMELESNVGIVKQLDPVTFG
jgi:hypothetical protein